MMMMTGLATLAICNCNSAIHTQAASKFYARNNINRPAGGLRSQCINYTHKSTRLLIIHTLCSVFIPYVANNGRLSSPRHIHETYHVISKIFFIFNYSVSSSLMSRRKSSSSFLIFLHQFLSIIISRRSNLFFRKGSKY